MQAKFEGLSKTVGVPKVQKRPPAPALEEFASSYEDRNQGIVAVYATGKKVANRTRSSMGRISPLSERFYAKRNAVIQI